MQVLDNFNCCGLEIISRDVFEIADAVKSIDGGYQIAYNKRLHRFELHHSDCVPTLQLVLPFNELDYRSYLYVQRTRVARIMAEIEGIDGYNDSLEEKYTKKATDEGKYIVKNTIFGG